MRQMHQQQQQRYVPTPQLDILSDTKITSARPLSPILSEPSSEGHSTSGLPHEQTASFGPVQTMEAVGGYAMADASQLHGVTPRDSDVGSNSQSATHSIDHSSDLPQSGAEVDIRINYADLSHAERPDDLGSPDEHT